MKLEKISVAEIKRRIKAHSKWLEDRYSGQPADFSYCDLTGRDLEGVDLSFNDLRYAKFVGADLSHAKLNYCNMSNTDFSNAKMMATRIWHSNACFATFDFAYLMGATFDSTDFLGSSFVGANMRFTRWTNANVRDCKFQKATLHWYSREIVGQILEQAAYQNESPSAIYQRRLDLAILISNKAGECWKEWLALNHPDTDWAVSVLMKYVNDEDDAPDSLTTYKSKLNNALESFLSK